MRLLIALVALAGLGWLAGSPEARARGCDWHALDLLYSLEWAEEESGWASAWEDAYFESAGLGWGPVVRVQAARAQYWVDKMFREVYPWSGRECGVEVVLRHKMTACGSTAAVDGCVTMYRESDEPIIPEGFLFEVAVRNGWVNVSTLVHELAHVLPQGSSGHGQAWRENLDRLLPIARRLGLGG